MICRQGLQPMPALRLVRYWRAVVNIEGKHFYV